MQIEITCTHFQKLATNKHLFRNENQSEKVAEKLLSKNRKIEDIDTCAFGRAINIKAELGLRNERNRVQSYSMSSLEHYWMCID